MDEEEEGRSLRSGRNAFSDPLYSIPNIKVFPLLIVAAAAGKKKKQGENSIRDRAPT